MDHKTTRALLSLVAVATATLPPDDLAIPDDIT
jgi:hypothetical protein